MKIKSIINEDDVCNLSRYNPNTKGTHLFISEGTETEEKRDYSNIALLTLMYKRGFFNSDFKEMVTSSEEMVREYEEKDVMGL